ncbi:P-loop containing nucleoside triphosphate hydrolase [Fusarium oxysporum f. sp. vasinfectum]|nr:P-loop containing nucleoside triphosphate hydrolase [Fusarium oxysporum f. sp. vasinfectum]
MPRKGSAKVRTGCVTCRVKCDEEKSSCKRYLSTGRVPSSPASGLHITPVKRKKRTGFSLNLEQFEQLQKSRWRQLKAIDISSDLSRLFNRPSTFKTGQYKVLRAIMKQEHPIVTVLPTSGGKSLLFQLPAAACPSGVTIVVVHWYLSKATSSTVQGR